MTASCSKRFARVLADVRQDIDNFLDPAVLALVDHDAKAAAAAKQDASELEPATEELRLEVLGLRGEGETLLAKLEGVSLDCESNRSEAERHARKDVAELARLRQLKGELEREGRAKKRRAQEAEGEALQLRGERDLLAAEREDLKSQMTDVETETETERRRLAEEVQTLQEALAAARAQSAALPAVAVPDAASGNEDGLRDQVASLQDEVSSLHRLLEQAAPDRQLAAQLRLRHAEYEEELRELRTDKAQVSQLRSQNLRLEQEEAKLRAALEARSNALREAEDVAHGARLAKRDLAAFAAAAATIVGGQGVEAASASAVPTPADLNLAWVRLQGEVSSLRQKSCESQQSSEQAQIRERHAQTELGQHRVTLATTQARLEAGELDLRRSRDEVATLTARASVLRKAISQHNPGEAPAVQVNPGVEEELRAQVEAEQRRAADLEAVSAAKQRAIDSLTAELSSLRQEHSKLSDMEVKAGQLQRVSEDLRRVNRELERDQERLGAELEAAKREAMAGPQVRDYDPATTKVLHFRHGPGVNFAAKGGQEETITALREEIRRLREASGSTTAAGDLEGRQASRQLERFKKATKKYVQDFREGTYGLLGWKVEMKGEGKTLKWHLTSSYQDGQELVFQLRPGEAGNTPQFDLLSTPWGEQLQADRHAMAYLEVYRSIPGFLAHITAELLSRHTIPG